MPATHTPDPAGQPAAAVAPRRPHHRTVDRVAAILDAVAHAPTGLSLSQLAARLEAPVSSIQGLVNGLAAVGYLTEEGKRFLLGPATYVLNLAAGRRPAAGVTQDDLEELSARTGVDVLVAVRVGDSVVYTSHAGPWSIQRLAYRATEYRASPLLCATAGWVILAFADERDLRAHLATEGERHPGETTAFLDRIEHIRRTRVAFSHGLGDPDVSAVAVPLGGDGPVDAAILAIGRHEQVDGRSNELGAVLQAAVERWQSRSKP
ncbi:MULTISPECIES: IclR family transcriptional regulator [Kitasatospora]|uniref:IclR family transcriptional regulator n=1 Tax=Kitasatospora TaxID=2063 RepID=UPI000C7025E0|nr:helix-turn-helix domain-containing protein [Kitasatospora sp. GP30]MDH6145051.1 DNA-binding IclR family transcriptional regulator [Kitasatospora sp. GP30]